jgi:hypothetical protein
MADANCAYTLIDADDLAALDDFDLMMIEQPLAWDDVVEHAFLQRKIKTPMRSRRAWRAASRCKGTVSTAATPKIRYGRQKPVAIIAIDTRVSTLSAVSPVAAIRTSGRICWRRPQGAAPSPTAQ